jgi:hypothetical protein
VAISYIGCKWCRVDMVSAVLYVVYLLLRHKNRQIKGEQNMTNLTQANLEAMLIELCKQVGEKGETVTIKPTKIIYRPSYLAKLGLTIDDVIKLVEKEKNT